MTRKILTDFSLLEALNADQGALERHVGRPAALLLAATKHLVDCAKFNGMRARPMIPRGEEVVDFLQQLLGCQPTESLIVLYADSKHRVLCADVITSELPDAAHYNTRKIVLHALDRAASGVLIVHNHPSGDPCPSTQDIRVTRDFVDALKPFNITLLDHLVVAEQGISSLRDLRLI